MICIESLHISLNRILLLAVGLWPYQQSILVQFQLMLLFGILTTFIFFQFTAFVTSKCTPDLLIKVLSSALFYITYLIEYNGFRLNIEVVRCLLEQVQHICNELRDENEIIIIRKYEKNAERYTAGFILLSMLAGSVLTLYAFWPCVLDILLPINESRPHPPLQFATEYFVLDQEKHFYLILLHALAAISVGGVVMLATGTILLVVLQHACGMFRIATYRIEHAMAIGTLHKNNMENEDMIYEGLIYAVDIHRKAMKLSKSLISRFNVSYFFLVIVGVICGSLNLFRVVSIKYDARELSLPVFFITIHLSFVVVSNYIAQDITDHNNHMFTTVYNVQWYAAPLHIQKIILFLLQRGTKAFNLSVAGLFVGSLESAATVLSASVSYFTVLYSMQH